MVQVVESSKTAVKMHVQKDIVYNGIRDCFSKIYKEAGMRGLYRGVGMLATIQKLSLKYSILPRSNFYIRLPFQLRRSTVSFLTLD